MINTEEKFDHVTTEVYYTTKKTEITFENAALAAWKDLPATAEQLATLNSESMSEVSGVGTYTTTFTLADGWTKDTPAMLRIGSTNGSIAQVYVNGQSAGGVDTRSLELDITGLLVEGENTVEVVLPTTLTNRLRVLGRGGVSAKKPVQDYGMVGEVSVVPYTLVNAQEGVLLNLTGEETATVNQETLTFTLTADNTRALATATVSFAVDGLTDPVVDGVNGWQVIDQKLDNGVLTAVLVHVNGVSGAEAAMLTVTGGHAGKEGTICVKLTDAVLSAYLDNGGEEFVSTVLHKVTVETRVEYHIYDVNRDGVVDQLDITRAQRCYGMSEGDEKWNALADVNGDKVVDITDLILILNNYSK